MNLSIKEHHQGARNANCNSSSKGLFLRSAHTAPPGTGYIVTSDEYGTLSFTDPDNFFSIYDSIIDLNINNPIFGQVIVPNGDAGWTNGDFYYSTTQSRSSQGTPKWDEKEEILNIPNEITITNQLSIRDLGDIAHLTLIEKS